jgi:hypothetical protein
MLHKAITTVWAALALALLLAHSALVPPAVGQGQPGGKKARIEPGLARADR